MDVGDHIVFLNDDFGATDVVQSAEVEVLLQGVNFKGNVNL